MVKSLLHRVSQGENADQSTAHCEEFAYHSANKRVLSMVFNTIDHSILLGHLFWIELGGTALQRLWFIRGMSSEDDFGRILFNDLAFGLGHTLGFWFVLHAV